MVYRNRRKIRIDVCAAALVAFTLPAMAQAESGQTANSSEEAPWKVDIYYENDTRYRGADATGDVVGLSKFRNTMQVEASRPLNDGWSFGGTFRGTFDGVYRMNSDQYGANAGKPVQMGSTAVPGGSVPFGGGLNQAAVAGAFGLPGNTFGFNSTNPNAPNYNPNSGLQILGQRWHDASGTSELAIATPVRPCDIDKRGCADFGGYGNSNLSQLESPEFNERLDFIREAYVKKTVDLEDGKQLFVKLGRQQVVWGRSDLFRVLDVINPVDYSRNNIYDELQDIRIPMWIAQTEYRMGSSDAMQERNLQVVWNVDQFRPDNLGQCGTPNVMLDAGCLFRGMKNLWDNGGTVGNFASASGTSNGPFLAADFGPNQIGIRNVNLPEWSLDNTQIGIKYEGVTKDGLSFSANLLSYRSQLPSLHGFSVGAQNPFTGSSSGINNVPPAGVNNVPVQRLIAFDMVYPRVQLVGGSLDFAVDSINTAVRMEAAVTSGEEFVNTKHQDLYSTNNVFRSVIGLDRPFLIPFINPNRTTLFSAQMFYQHIYDYQLEQGPFGQVGMPDWQDNVTATLLIKAFVSNDRISPQVIFAYDAHAHAYAVAPSVDWLVSDKFKVTFGANIKGGESGRTAFDDCRSCNPYAPFTSYSGGGSGSGGLSSIEPLGRFRAGPIGAAMYEDEVHVTMRYQF